jgi:subtilisin family serine protease
VIGLCFVSASVAMFATNSALAVSKSSSSSLPKIDAVPGEYVVELRASAVEQMKGAFALERLSMQLGVEVVDRVRSEMVLVRAAGEPAEMLRLQTRLQEHVLVERVEPNYLYHTNRLPNDPDLGRLWGLRNVGASDTDGQVGVAGIDVGAERAWDIETGKKSVVVAVIDTGIDFNHPDLKSQAWVNEAELNGLPGIDDDGNGLIDDIYGYSFAGNKGDATDDNGHGTHCAGTIGAKGDDGKGLVGVAWDVSMMAIKFLDKNGSGTLANAIKSIDYARTMGAHIMSNSWGGGGRSELLLKAIEDANAAGILFVAAAGNDANNNDAFASFPASYDVPNVLSVAAISNTGALASFSNYGVKSVHVAAPGVNIVSTIPGGKYDSYSGTSMATPHVSGIAALLLSNNQAATHVEMKQRIMESSRPLYNLKTRVASGGIADAYYALSGVTPPVDPNDPSLLPNSKPHKFSSAHPYKENTRLEERVHVPGAKRIAVRFSRFETEPGYDTVTFFDGTGKQVSALSGRQDPGVTSSLIQGDTVVIRFSSDESIQAYGFDVESILYE